MANIGSLNVDLTLQSAQFINGLKQASAATTKAASSISSAMNLAKVGIAGFIGAFSVDMLTSQIQQAFDYGDAIVDLADRTGATTKTIQEFRYAAQLSGSSVENADAAVEKFAKNLGAAQNGNKAMAKSFADLGVTSTDTDTALRQTMDGISKLGTVTQRNQKTIELFGKSAGDLTLLLGDGTNGFDALAQAAQQYGIVLDDHVLRNGGKVNDQLDTMKMILNAQMANMIIQNADALMQLANGFMTAAAAAVHFFSAMQVNKDMSLQSGNPWDWDMPSIVGGRLQGKSNDDIRNEARDRLKSTADGRRALYKSIAEEYNRRKAAGEDPNSRYMQALRGEGQQMIAAHRAGNVSLSPPATGNTGTLPKSTGGGSKSKGSSRPLKSDEELEREWMRAFIDARGDLYSAQANLSNDPTERAELDANSLRNRYLNNISRIDSDVGTDKEIREGKKRYTEAQAEQLKEIEKDIFDAQYDRVIRDRDEEIAKDRLAISEAGLRNDADLMSAEMSLARSSRERRDLSLKMVENQFALEKLQLEAIIASKTATDAEKKIAEERLKMLPVLKGAAQEQAKRQTQSPLEQYLDAIPKTRDEMNDALESVEVEGLKSLEDGLMGVVKGTKSVGEAFSDMAETIIDGLLKIALEQAIIKPLGNLLFGSGDSGGGGILGSLAKGVISGLTGKRANGGYSGAGEYLVGERGPEIVRFGSNANVTPTRALKNAANDNSGGVTVRIDSIVSNDPEAIRRATMQGVAQAMPMIAQQASDKTIARLQRRGL
ncbi:phage tail tape measure C-terminal domain-containing protein [Sphingomonas sp. HITSZ_GF]|uniref:phage tail tape measure C-terminal domain-containing protein n=1 Tax=Sphingomonas sp. HITSZ_GF TaxID=3037247 RepID=UPI00240D739A|nr:phage tail tape measure C-terminal domain-containing protein [Sphingomonas sp. HITSZ_GF]MDG2532074.1 phage tail tape measure C-terminal domain-containing protein [Sphingomonas sp. HITSZ_GF]